MSRTYKELVDAATFGVELFREDIQNRGTVAMTMQVQGTPTFRRIHNTVGLAQTVVGHRIESTAAVAPLVSFASEFTVEIGLYRYGLAAAGSVQGMFTQLNTSGFQILLDQLGLGADNALSFALYTAAGALARWGTTGTNSVMPGSRKPIHVLMQITPSTGALSAWIDNVAVTTTIGGAGVAAMPANGTVLAGRGGGKENTIVTRSWQGSLDAAERQTLYGNFSTLIVNARV